ncbi:MAG: hypothetical protein ACXWQO_16455 [Bdellovibrionota bacterium]
MISFKQLKFTLLTVVVLSACSPTRYANEGSKFTDSAVTSEGGFAGNGLDELPFGAQAAWFTGSKAIRYCLVVSDRFGVQAGEAEQIIAKAFKTWESYAKKKELKSLVSGLSYNFNAESILVCDGTEDLKFFLGLENDQIKKARRSYADPAAFAYKLETNEDRSWSKGIVWIAPIKSSLPVSAATAFNGILLHELGHIFGNGHVAGTIMDPQQIYDVLSNKVTDSYGGKATLRMTEIDQKRELLTASGQDLNFESELEPANLDPRSGDNFTAAFYSLTGKAVRPPLVGRLMGTVFNATLVLKDQSGEYSFPIETANPSSPGIPMGGPVFELYDFKGNSLTSQWNYGAGFIGKLTGLGGKTYPLMLTRNLDYTVQVLVDFNGTRLCPFGIFGF